MLYLLDDRFPSAFPLPLQAAYNLYGIYLIIEEIDVGNDTQNLQGK